MKVEAWNSLMLGKLMLRFLLLGQNFVLGFRGAVVKRQSVYYFFSFYATPSDEWQRILPIGGSNLLFSCKKEVKALFGPDAYVLIQSRLFLHNYHSP